MLGDARSGKLSENMLGFGRMLRRAGLPVDASRLILAVQAAQLVGVERREDLKAALESVFLSRSQDREVFDQLFEALFRNPEVAKQLMAQLLPKAQGESPPIARKPRAQEALTVPPPASAQQKKAQEHEVKWDAAMSMGAGERLKNADFSSLSASELKLVEQLVRRIPMRMPTTQSRRTRSGGRGGRLDWPGSTHHAMTCGGEWVDLRWRKRRQVPLPLLLLVDISGSMERYARLLLAFLHHATADVPRAVYCFGSRLSDLNEAFRLRDADLMFEQANVIIRDYASGTRLAASLETLREEHRRQLVGRRTVVLMVTDGLDMGKPERLERELDWLKAQTRRILWLNPLLRYEGYEPLAAGAQVLNKKVHASLPIHNLTHLEALASSIQRLMRQAS